jgi:hypothetical protein
MSDAMKADLFQIVRRAIQHRPLQDANEIARLRVRLAPHVNALNINALLPIAFHTVVVALDAALSVPMQPTTRHLLIIACNCVLCRLDDPFFRRRSLLVQTLYCVNWVLVWAMDTMAQVPDEPQLYCMTIDLLHAVLRGVPWSTADCFHSMLGHVSDLRSLVQMYSEIERCILLWESALLHPNAAMMVDLHSTLAAWTP